MSFRVFVQEWILAQGSRFRFSDPELERGPGGGYDHLALTVEGMTPSELIAHLQANGVAIEMQTERLWRARGDGWACYVRDPDGYRVELKIYETSRR